jgi:hypothetical protein
MWFPNKNELNVPKSCFCSVLGQAFAAHVFERLIQRSESAGGKTLDPGPIKKKKVKRLKNNPSPHPSLELHFPEKSSSLSWYI